MSDPRESILARLPVTCLAADGIVASARNKLDVAGVARPAALIFDGSTSRREMEKRLRFSARQMMELTPQIRLLIRSDDGDAAGALLTTLGMRIVREVLNDEMLREYVGRNGDIQFDEFSVDEPNPEGREYRASVMMTFTYPFHLLDA